MRYVVVFIASAHNALGKPDWIRIHLALSFKVLFILSATPFCSGVPDIVLIILISCSEQKYLNYLGKKKENHAREILCKIKWRMCWSSS